MYDNEPLVFLRDKVAFASPKITRWPMRSSGCASYRWQVEPRGFVEQSAVAICVRQ